MPIARSYLFVPGNRPERYAKACDAGADAVIVDLEDAVPDAEKDAARAALAQWLSPARAVLVRVNAADTPWFARDLDVCAAQGVAGVVLPKSERAEAVAALAARIGPQRRVVPLIETAQGFHAALAIAQAPQVERLAFGAIDFALDLGIRDDDLALLRFRSELVLVSRLAGLAAPIDGVSTALDDAAALRRDTLRGRDLGFGAKLCIHPKQLAIVHACYRPTADEIAWAKRVVDAAAAAAGAAVAVDGKMVDRPVIRTAEQILADAARSGAAR
jgi:citrate lyase subunit beta/citryl-CoA lyase